MLRSSGWEKNVRRLRDSKTPTLRKRLKKIHKIARKGPLTTSRSIRSLNGHITCEPEDIKKRWGEYVASLFNDDNKAVSYESGPSILKEEVQWALQNSKTGKTAGPDEVIVEMLTALEEEGVDLLWKLFNIIYETGQISTEMLKSVFIVIPKKLNTLQCENHRTISLKLHTLKLLLKIILRRIRRKLLPQIPVSQYGFMPDTGTRNAIFVIHTLRERSIQHQQNVFLYFDYQKAFDKVGHFQLLTILKQIGIDDKD